MPEMLEWVRRAGFAPADIAEKGMRCIHVAGSSGKGSVCAMVESILMQYRGEGGLDGSIGTFTSPHLVDVRERIRIDGRPVGKYEFIRSFQELWKEFGKRGGSEGHAGGEIQSENSRDMKVDDSPELRPGYFRFLMILAMRIFMEMGVKTAIVECGIGGEYDSTNILPAEAVSVSAITKLELDHVELLGGTVEEIAWHKAGIIKKGVPIFTTLQPATALKVIDERADEKDSLSTMVERLPALSSGNIKLGLLGDFQKDNASLAVSVAVAHLRSRNISEYLPTQDELSNGKVDLPQKFITALETVKWPGRCEIYNHNGVQYYIDGAHTKEGMQAVGAWFASHVMEAFKQDEIPESVILIFNQDQRDGQALLRTLMIQLTQETGLLGSNSLSNNRSLSPQSVLIPRMFNVAAFCPNQAFPSEGHQRDLSAQEALMKRYTSWDHNPISAVYGSVREAVDVAEKFAYNDFNDPGIRTGNVVVLVTGSIHLVGAFLQNVPEKQRGTGLIKGFVDIPGTSGIVENGEKSNSRPGIDYPIETPMTKKYRP